MGSSEHEDAPARRPVKMAILAAALAVAACFGAAFTFVGEEPAQAEKQSVMAAR